MGIIRCIVGKTGCLQRDSLIIFEEDDKMAEKKAVLPWGLEKGKLTPGSSKAISMNKLKAFNIGTMNVKKVLSKKEQEDLRKKEDEAAAAKVYEEFVQTFEDTGKGTLNRSWVKGGTVNPDRDRGSGGSSNSNVERNTTRIYKPSSKIAEAVMAKSEEREERKELKPVSNVNDILLFCSEYQLGIFTSHIRTKKM